MDHREGGPCPVQIVVRPPITRTAPGNNATKSRRHTPRVAFATSHVRMRRHLALISPPGADTYCRLCQDHPETPVHILTCPDLTREHFTFWSRNMQHFPASMIFIKQVKKQLDANGCRIPHTQAMSPTPSPINNIPKCDAPHQKHPERWEMLLVTTFEIYFNENVNLLVFL